MRTSYERKNPLFQALFIPMDYETFIVHRPNTTGEFLRDRIT